MTTATFKKLSSDLKPIDMSLEYELLDDRIKEIQSEGESEGYYESKRNEIKLSWLNGGGGSDVGNGATQEQNYIWHANMPISLWQCREIYEAAKRGLPKKTVENLIFADYDLNKNEEELFDVIYNYAQAKGLMIVADELFEGAKHGDPRAVKMYLEVSGLLLASEEDKETQQRKKLMRISFDM